MCTVYIAKYNGIYDQEIKKKKPVPEKDRDISCMAIQKGNTMINQRI